jgi:hypothetical protein
MGLLRTSSFLFLQANEAAEFPEKLAAQANSAPSSASVLEVAPVRAPYLESIPGIADFIKQNGARFVY